MIRYSNRHPTTARGLAETVNGNLKGAEILIRGRIILGVTLAYAWDEHISVLYRRLDKIADFLRGYERKVYCYREAL